MGFKKELLVQNVVIIANNFNPTVFSSHWLIRNGFCSETEILPTSIFSDQITQVMTDRFALIVLPNQIQFVKSNTYQGSFETLVSEILYKIIDKLKEVPYTAIGINFQWALFSEDDSIEQYSKTLFYKADSNLFKYFNRSDAHFGAYMSTNFEECRLKLDIKPVVMQKANDNQHVQALLFIFNFHRDISGQSAVQELLNCLKKWNSFFLESEKLMAEI